jgi:predicted amidohydrolase YtcJ
VLGQRPRQDHRHRIEHAEHVVDAQIARMAELGVIASMQPNFAGRWQGPEGLYEQRFGDRHRLLNPHRKVMEAGVALAFGSDGMPLGPLYGVRSAMNHPEPTQSMTFVEALHAYTLGAAAAGRAEDVIGSLEVGKQADLVVLSGDPETDDTTAVDEVFVGGRRRLNP